MENYELRWGDLWGIIPYALRNAEVPNKKISRKLLIRAIPLTFYTIGLSAIPFGIWKGLEALVKKTRS
jgi:hypothetical protein